MMQDLARLERSDLESSDGIPGPTTESARKNKLLENVQGRHAGRRPPRAISCLISIPYTVFPSFVPLTDPRVNHSRDARNSIM